MASTVQIKVGALASVEASLGAASDAVIGTKIREWAVGSGVADASDNNQQVADKVAEWVRDQFRAHVMRWHIANARTAFEANSRAAGETYLDIE